MTPAQTLALARAEIFWLDSSHCRERADDYCPLPESFAAQVIADAAPRIAEPQPIPEPSTLSVMLAGLAVVSYIVRRRKGHP